MSDKTRDAWAALHDAHEVIQKSPAKANLAAFYARSALAAASALVAFVEAYEIAHDTQRRGDAAATGRAGGEDS